MRTALAMVGLAACLLAACRGSAGAPTDVQPARPSDPRGGAAAAQTQPQFPPAAALDLRVDQDGWGKAPVRDAQAVFRSAARELQRYFPDARLEPIKVSAKGGPIVWHKRDADGCIVMKLDTADTYWAQYAFQFSHEFCHVLCRYDADPSGQKWFEESVCELASLFVLRRMAETWKTDPPYRNWRDFGVKLNDYADQRLAEAKLPAGQTLTQWYAQNAKALEQKADDRPRNRVVAGVLLPLFEEQPQHWRAVWHLNDAKPAAAQRFPAYLQDWHDHAPVVHRPFIARLAREFAVTLTRHERAPVPRAEK